MFNHNHLPSCNINCPLIKSELTSTTTKCYISSEPSYRQPRPNIGRLKNISDMESYADAELMSNYVTEEDADDRFTTRNHLEGCNTVDDVLTMIGNMNQGNQLWEEELILYFDRIVKLQRQQQSSVEWLPVLREEGANNQLLDSRNFQILLTKTLHTAPYLPTSHLAGIFIHLQTLGIPFQSNVSKAYVMGILSRINDFFPKDVALCYRGLRKVPWKFHNEVIYKSLQQGLLLHTDNLALDEPFFHKCLVNSSLVSNLHLLEFISRKGSRDAVQATNRGIMEIIRKRKSERNYLRPYEAKFLNRVLTLCRQRHPYLMKISSRSINAITSGGANDRYRDGLES